ncbi:hypothetical protein PBI_CANTARE_121 [Brevibacterium phage Cantare]|uniref:Uncharacterized protein n=1 Tax=Brevibacterium phage Cantare TaxID=2338395 RepID=A0A3G3LYY8_9CAUD|nr:hypothetical protein PQD70_gp121 [Brevibacterium phage Cantare]AYQ99341.1 hypothetical protein PBI_CANTARE_121 [Brevibacterium phage Cantare]
MPGKHMKQEREVKTAYETNRKDFEDAIVSRDIYTLNALKLSLKQKLDAMSAKDASKVAHGYLSVFDEIDKLTEQLKAKG